MNMGRYQQGQIVYLGVITTDGGDVAVQPDAAPLATISNSDSEIVATIKLPMSGGYDTFLIGLFLGIEFPLGTYTVEYSWNIGIFAGSAGDSFDVIHGGDVGGRVISMFAYDRPEARYVVAQLSSGNLVQGRNPKF